MLRSWFEQESTVTLLNKLLVMVAFVCVMTAGGAFQLSFLFEAMHRTVFFQFCDDSIPQGPRQLR